MNATLVMSASSILLTIPVTSLAPVTLPVTLMFSIVVFLTVLANGATLSVSGILILTFSSSTFLTVPPSILENRGLEML